MKIKLKNAEILNAIETIRETEETGKLGYALARNLRFLLDGGKEFLDIRDKLLIQYGDRTGQNEFVISTDKIDEYRKALEEYQDIEHEIDIYPVNEEIFIGGNLNTKQLYNLDFIVDRRSKDDTGD